MKAVLEFDLNNPDEIREHLRCVMSLDMAIALFEITHNMMREFEDNVDYDKICEKINELTFDINIENILQILQ